jgi:hypothetical protein
MHMFMTLNGARRILPDLLRVAIYRAMTFGHVVRHSQALRQAVGV